MAQRDRQRRVVQKLAFARWHVAWSESVAEDVQQRAALLVSAVWHGTGAYRAFLSEIAHDEHNIPSQPLEPPQTATELAESYSDYMPPMLAECVNLEQDAGWLQDLLRWQADNDRDEAPHTLSSTLIGSSDSAPDAAVLTHVLEQLDTLIERLRGDMLEY